MAEKFHMITLGCDKNRVDAEMMVAKLLDAGYEFSPNPSKADFAIINTCGFKSDAIEESISEIVEMGMYKEVGKPKYIIVTGCMAQRFQHQVMSDMQKEVDAVIGIGANADIVSVVKRVLSGKKVLLFPPKENLPLEGKKIQSTHPHYAYLKIAEGCNNKCTYCTIPSIRGRYRSRKIEDIVSQAKEMAQNGVREIILVAQDTTSYGIDLYGKYMLVNLLEELVKIEDIRWIRLLYCYPHRITDSLLSLMAKEEKIVNYLDIPMQHCNEKVLREMNRRGNKDELEKQIKHIREMVPGIYIRTTFIIGFPGETKEEFVELFQFAHDMKFERMGCFEYSQEENTIAGERNDQVSESDKLVRLRSMRHQQAYIMDEFNESLKGKIFTVIHDDYNSKKGYYFGRYYGSAPDVDPIVMYDLPAAIPSGIFLKIKIVDSRYSDLIGEVIDFCEDESLIFEDN
ncbi:MAG: 30S ribosomal protein S12 methylthiotransferase RimO [Clostridia bacterium]|nr:30S ribosomal protein S12 methylthiotransferase RimO [Clostridia bacterium]